MLQTKKELVELLLSEVYGFPTDYPDEGTKAIVKALLEEIKNLTEAELASWISKYYE